MSADLFEAFGGGGQGGTSGNQNNQSKSPEPTTNISEPTFFDVPGSYIFASQVSPMSNVTKIEPIFQQSSNGGNDVLFDAEDEEGDDDDFGDFEDVDRAQQSNLEHSARRQRPNSEIRNDQSQLRENGASLIDLLSQDEAPAHPTSAADVFATVPTIAETQTEPHSISTTVRSELGDEADGWGDFEAIDSQRPTSSPPPKKLSPRVATMSNQSTSLNQSPIKPRVFSQKAVPSSDDADDWDTFEDGQTPAIPASLVLLPTAIQSTSSIPSNPQRPTNVPPPSILLSLLPQATQSLVNLILSSKSASDISSDVITTFRASARLVSTSARALRWRRDTLLSQSTRIGVAGKSGGMKLSSLNKGESVKEEREAAEAVEVWNGNLHYFSKVISTSRMKPGSLRLSINAAVNPLTGAGVIQSTIVCPICGLKRSERLVGVDERGEDVFGEYWLENWGHRECAEWWYRWKEKLGQR